jgi:hypothetical protein
MLLSAPSAEIGRRMLSHTRGTDVATARRMLLSNRSRRSVATFYGTAIGVVIGLYCMTLTCSSWLSGATPAVVPAVIGLGAFLLATLTVLGDGRRGKRAGATTSPRMAPPASPAR